MPLCGELWDTVRCGIEAAATSSFYQSLRYGFLALLAEALKNRRRTCRASQTSGMRIDFVPMGTPKDQGGEAARLANLSRHNMDLIIHSQQCGGDRWTREAAAGVPRQQPPGCQLCSQPPEKRMFGGTWFWVPKMAPKASTLKCNAELAREAQFWNQVASCLRRRAWKDKFLWHLGVTTKVCVMAHAF